VVRKLTAQDLDSAKLLSDAANWNQTAADWARVLLLEPQGCFCVEADNRIVATATAVCHGRDLAWIGMVLTHPESRRKGYARLVMEAALSWLDSTGVAASRLDATDMGQPLYEALGYRVECDVERWRGEGRGTSPLPQQQPDFDLDRTATGTDRTPMLQALAPIGCLRVANGYVMLRPGRVAAYLGPCLAESPEAAELLIQRALAAASGPVYWDVLPGNTASASLAQRFGFSPFRHLKRMVRGQAPPEQRSLIYALSGFETG
jgi:RimJ/RimL family protein N-acetyltransferase